MRCSVLSLSLLLGWMSVADAEPRYGTPDYRLQRALQGCQQEPAKAALAEGADPDLTLSDGTPGLVRCIANRPLVELLLDAGADANAAEPSGGLTPLLALTEKRSELSKRGAYMGSLLLAHGADPDRADRKSETAVHKAAQQAAGAALLQLLLRQGAPVAVRDQLQRTPLHRAAYNGHSANVQLLLSAGAAVDVLDKEGFTPLGRATERGRIAVVQLLLAGGADPNQEMRAGQTALHLAIARRRADLVAVLLAGGADPLHRSQSLGYPRATPIEYALKLGHQETVLELMQHKQGEAEP